MVSNSGCIITQAEVNQPCPKSDKQLLCNVHILLSTCLRETSMSDSCYKITKKIPSLRGKPNPDPCLAFVQDHRWSCTKNEAFPADTDTKIFLMTASAHLITLSSIVREGRWFRGIAKIIACLLFHSPFQIFSPFQPDLILIFLVGRKTPLLLLRLYVNRIRGPSPSILRYRCWFRFLELVIEDQLGPFPTLAFLPFYFTITFPWCSVGLDEVPSWEGS